MVTVAKLSADVSADGAEFESGLKRATNALNNAERNWKRSLDNSSRGFSSLGSKVYGTTARFFDFRSAIAGVVSGAGLLALARTSLNAADNLRDLSDSTGLSTTKLQAYTLLAKQAGVDSDSFRAALIKLSNNVADGNTPYRNINQALDGYITRIANAKSPTEATAAASEAFGKKIGARLIPAFQNGTKYVDEFTAALVRQGAILDEKVINDAAKFNDQIDILFTILQTNFQQGLLAAFASDSKEVADIYKDPALAQGVKDLGTALGDVLNFVLKNMPAAITLVKTFSAGLAGMAVGGLVGGLPGALIGGVGSAAVAGGVSIGSNMRKQDKAALTGGLLPPSGAPSPAGVSPASVGAQSTQSLNEQAAAATKKAKAFEAIIYSLKNESAALTTQVDLYGQKDAVIDSAVKKQQIEAQLAKDGIHLTEMQRTALQAELDTIKEKGVLLEDLAAQQKLDDEDMRVRKQAIEELGFTFTSAFEDAIAGGKNFHDVLNGLIQDIIKLALRMAITQPIAKGLSGLFDGFLGGASGGGFGDIFGSQGPLNRLFSLGSFSAQGPLPAFADGGYLRPGEFGVVGDGGGPEIAYGGRTGKTIIPMDGMSGGPNGSNYYIDARGADPSAVLRLQAAMKQALGPGAIEQRVSNAMARGSI